MLSLGLAVVAVTLTSMSPGQYCTSWDHGPLDQTYEGRPASNRCTCKSSGYYGPSCRKCGPWVDTSVPDGGTPHVYCMDLAADTGCSSVPGSAPLLVGLLGLLTWRRRQPPR
jgi:MYXO-CTERM domain-containing protein